MSGDGEGVIKNWNQATGYELFPLPRLEASVEGISFDPAGDALVAMSVVGAMHVFECPSKPDDPQANGFDRPLVEISAAEFFETAAE
mgnify:CR=1 FL=1